MLKQSYKPIITFDYKSHSILGKSHRLSLYAS